MTCAPKYRKVSGTYCILNKVNGKRYVGSASESLYGRWSVHLSNLRRDRHHNIYLQRAWNKYGESNFEFVVLKPCPPEVCLRSEQRYIDKFNATDPQFGYNLCPIAGNNLGVKYSEETRARLYTPERRKRLSRALLESPEVLERLIEASRTPEALAKRSASQKGRTITIEHRDKISAALSGRKVPAVIVEKTASKLRGKSRPESFRAKMRVAMLGKSNGSGKLGKKYGPNLKYQNNPIAIANKSEAARRSWAKRKEKQLSSYN
jgi:group I intron endonuclease